MDSKFIVSHILVRLPARSVRRFMCVCKVWRDAIDQDSFIREHRRLEDMSGGPHLFFKGDN
jgi:hypothetical protein